MSDGPITWWFDAEIARLEALRAELVAFEALAVKKGAVIYEPKNDVFTAVAEFPNGWWADLLAVTPYRGKLQFKYGSWVPGAHETRTPHNTWRQALARAESGGAS
jgi:hypothetical protein